MRIYTVATPSIAVDGNDHLKPSSQFCLHVIDVIDSFLGKLLAGIDAIAGSYHSDREIQNDCT